jgi:hypothetical protein
VKFWDSHVHPSTGVPFKKGFLCKSAVDKYGASMGIKWDPPHMIVPTRGGAAGKGKQASPTSGGGGNENGSKGSKEGPDSKYDQSCALFVGDAPVHLPICTYGNILKCLHQASGVKPLTVKFVRKRGAVSK